MTLLVWLIRRLLELCFLAVGRLASALLRVYRDVAELWYYVRCHTLTRYHILDLRDRGEGHGYRWGWCDRDHLMLLACFTLLRDFVEKEDPDVGLLGEEAYVGPGRSWQPGEREAVRQQIEDEKQIRELYDWWVRGRAEEHAAVSALLDGADDCEGVTVVHHPNFDEWSRRHEELEIRDDAQLLRLIQLRGRLWT